PSGSATPRTRSAPGCSPAGTRRASPPGPSPPERPTPVQRPEPVLPSSGRPGPPSRHSPGPRSAASRTRARGGDGSAAPHQPAHGRHQLGGHLVRLALLGALGHAVPHVPVEQAQRHLVQRGLDGADLREDVDAVAVVLDHPVDAAHLALDPGQPGLELVLGGGVPAGGGLAGSHSVLTILPRAHARIPLGDIPQSVPYAVRRLTLVGAIRTGSRQGGATRRRSPPSAAPAAGPPAGPGARGRARCRPAR